MSTPSKFASKAACEIHLTGIPAGRRIVVVINRETRTVRQRPWYVLLELVIAKIRGDAGGYTAIRTTDSDTNVCKLIERLNEDVEGTGLELRSGGRRYCIACDELMLTCEDSMWRGVAGDWLSRDMTWLNEELRRVLPTPVAGMSAHRH